MLRFLARHGLVRVIGGRAVPVLLVWDVLVLANRARRVPVVDRTVRRAGSVARQRIESAAAGLPLPARARGPWRSATPIAAAGPADPADPPEAAGPAEPADPTVATAAAD